VTKEFTHHGHEISGHARHCRIHVHVSIVTGVPERNGVRSELRGELVYDILELADISCNKNKTLSSKLKGYLLWKRVDAFMDGVIKSSSFGK
jgi:hypothetical protein